MRKRNLISCLLLLCAVLSCAVPQELRAETVAVDTEKITAETETAAVETEAAAEETDTAAKETDTAAFTDIVILSTTDIHGKCWDENILTDAPEDNNMLRVSTAVQAAREEYGTEQVVLIDNGDLYQGTPVSQVQLEEYCTGESDLPPAMSLCLTEIGYDAFVPGNHEFDFSWEGMFANYRWLEENGVPVLAANVCYDGSDGVHKEGEDAFAPYAIRTIRVNGHDHKIGILGLENPDIPRWESSDRFPGLLFAHPGNENLSALEEAQRVIPRMMEEGCEFLIISFHSGIGNTDVPLEAYVNSDYQGMRLAQGCGSIDMLILGHDHSVGYSNTFVEDHAGRQVLVVNGGGQEMTRTIYRFSEDASGDLTWELLDSVNLDLWAYEPDEALKEKLTPYAESAKEYVEEPVGTVSGSWDGSGAYYTEQTDTMDLVLAACIDTSSEHLKNMGRTPEELAEGLDHLDVDLAIAAPVTQGYIVQPGEISVKDISRLYRFSNIELVIPVTGKQLLDIMEENAAARLKARTLDGQTYCYAMNDLNTNLLFGGVNFTYDLYAPEGERVHIRDFSNGRAFDPDTVYLAAVNNYLLGNKSCGLRDFHEEDAVWTQASEGSGTIQDLIREYIQDACSSYGSLTPDAFIWNWDVACQEPEKVPEGEEAARYVKRPEAGHTYILYNEAHGVSFTDREQSGSYAGTKIKAAGNALYGPLPEDVLTFTVRFSEDSPDSLLLQDEKSRYLSCGPGGGLVFAEEVCEDDLSLWNLQETEGGYFLVSTGAAGEQALEYYKDNCTTYRLGRSGPFVFNFYEVGSDPIT